MAEPVKVKVRHPLGNVCMRISQTATVNTAVRKSGVGTYPRVDHLDFVLSSKYDHHSQWMVDKPNVLKNSTHFRTPCKKLEKKYQEVQDRDKEPDLIHPFIGQEKYRNSINHISVGLSSHHLPSTELGYGRKPN